MNRLFTFGCSFTEYAWPTWADLLGIGFDQHENWGLRGLGNRGITERIAECHVKNKFNKDDTIIIQWTSHLRNDWYHIHNLPDGRGPGWKTSGSIFSPNNSKVYTNSWINLFFYEPAFIMHTLNLMILAKKLIESTKANFFMTGIGDFKNLGNDINIDPKYGEYLSPDNSEELFSKYPMFKEYEHELYNLDNWIEPIKPLSNRYSDFGYKFLDEKNEYWIENHPSSMQYSLWLFENLSKKIQITDNTRNKITVTVDSIENIKKKTNTLSEFSEQLRATKNLGYIRWPNLLKGY